MFHLNTAKILLPLATARTPRSAGCCYQREERDTGREAWPHGRRNGEVTFGMDGWMDACM